MPRFSYSALRRRCPGLTLTPAQLARRLPGWGFGVDECRRSGSDWVLDLEVPYDRPDCLSHRGLARDLASLLGAALAPAPPSPAGAGEVGSIPLHGEGRLFRATRLVRADDPRPSPPELAARLRALGGTPFFAPADAVQLARLDCGAPIWAVDADRLRGPTLRLRRARPGETLEHAYGRTTLGPDDWVIADAAGPVVLGSLLEGSAFQVGHGTRRILLGGAALPAGELRLCGVRHGIAELQACAGGADEIQASLDEALSLLRARAGRLWTAGRKGRESSCVFARRDLERLSGFRLDARRLPPLLAPLGRVSPAGGGRLRLSGWRPDLDSPGALAAELVRRLGVDRVGARRPRSSRRAPDAALLPATRLLRRLRGELTGAGFEELLHFDFCAAESPEASPLRLDGRAPGYEGLALRRDLLGGLLREAAGRARGRRFFEAGTVYRRAGTGVAERALLCGLWMGGDEAVLARDARALLRALLGRDPGWTPLDPGGELAPGLALEAGPLPIQRSGPAVGFRLDLQRLSRSGRVS